MSYEKDPKMSPYIEGRRLFVEWCQNIKYATPIEFGSVGCPGLSDIDIGVVFDDAFDPNNCDLCQHLVRFPAKTKKIMNGGTLMLFPANIFKHILLVDDIQVKPLSGKICVEKNTDTEKHLVDLVQIIEWLPERMAAIYSELKKEKFDEKRLVGYFYSLCYSLKKIQNYSNNNKILNFINQVYSLRAGWASLNQDPAKTILKDLIGSYIDIFKEAVNDIVPFISTFFKIFRPNNSELGYNIYRNVHFNSSSDVGVFEKNNSIYINVPPGFFGTYLYYSKYNSSLGSIISRRIAGNIDIEITGEMKIILDRRIYIFSSLFTFVKSLNCGTGLYKFGWYLSE